MAPRCLPPAQMLFSVLVRLVCESQQAELNYLGLTSTVWSVLWSLLNAACLQRHLSTLDARNLSRSTQGQRLESVEDSRGFSAGFWNLLCIEVCVIRGIACFPSFLLLKRMLSHVLSSSCLQREPESVSCSFLVAGRGSSAFFSIMSLIFFPSTTKDTELNRTVVRIKR